MSHIEMSHIKRTGVYYPAREICECVGTSMAKVITREADGIGKPYQQVRLVIVTPSGIDDGAFYPAECVDIYSLAAITKLRDLLNQAISIAHTGASEEPVVEAVNQATIQTP